HLILKPKSLVVDFEETIKNMETLGEPIANLLAENGIDSFERVIEHGTEELAQIPGFEAEAAEILIELARSSKIQASETISPAVPDEEPEEELPLEEKPPEEEEEKAEEPTPVSSDAREDEPQEFPLGNLSHIDESIIEILEKNGFQTLAELSITPLEELLAIDGIDEPVARSILEQAKQVTENYENV
ncbi:MAG: helix-hairpin-helix domain-containing protein, partial [Nitrospinota bacterium]|nr:helix-hairpin-helix domain-containing protein [Nitrospinota bacterium]